MEDAFDRFTRLASKALGAPVSLVSLVDVDRQFFKSQIGLAEPWASARQTPLSHSFCKTVVADGVPLIVNDARSDPRMAGNLAIRDLGVIAYAGVPLRSVDGHVLGSVCAIESEPRAWTDRDVELLMDVSALVTGELELREALDSAEHRNRELEEASGAMRALHAEVEAGRLDAEAVRSATVGWAAHLAHEVRTPLYAARGLVEDLVTHAPLTDAAREDVTLVDAMLTETLSLVDEQLLAARQAGTRQIVRVTTVDVADLLGSLRGMMRPLTRPGVAFDIDELEVPVVLQTDAGKVAQILRNLVANALRHTDRGGVQVHTSLTDHDRCVTFRVSDTGEGIPAAFHDRIFEEYAQVPGARNASGSGLGLPLAAAMAAVLGGRVSLTRSSGAGATFTATVPLVFHTDDPEVTVVHEAECALG